MAHFGSFLLTLSLSDTFLLSLADSDSLWLIPVHSDSVWLTLAHSGSLGRSSAHNILAGLAKSQFIKPYYDDVLGQTTFEMKTYKTFLQSQFLF